jgi:predicted transcriptional regulator
MSGETSAYKAYQLIKEHGEKGILQYRLWKKLGLDSRRGSQIARKLEEKGLIERVKVQRRGKTSFILKSKRRPVNPDSVLEVPCAFCPEQERCGSREVSPETCGKLNDWLLKVVL